MEGFIVVCYIIIINFVLDSWAELYLPKIYPKHNEVEFESQCELALGCVGIEPVTWTIPNSRINRKYSIQPVNISRENAIDPKYLFGSILIITKALVSDIGYYTCHGVTTNKDNPTRAKNIYVYVKDNYQLYYSQGNKDWITVKYEIHLNLTLPCRPTSQDVSVSLMEQHNQAFYEVLPNLAKYNPHLGYSLKISEMTNPNQIYKCVFKRNNSTQNMTVQSDAQGVSNFKRPYIDVPVEYMLKYIGENLELNCSLIVEEDSRFELKWEVPNNSTGRLNIENFPNISIKKSKVLLTRLTIKNLTAEYEGQYKCYIAPDYKEDIFHEIYVKVADKNSNSELPRIHSNNVFLNSNSSYVIMNSNEDLVLNCQNERNITWSYPQSDLPDLDEHISITYSISTENKIKIYHSTLFLGNSHYKNGGFFYCYETGTEKDNPYKSSKIFVFIEDEENIVLYPVEKEHNINPSTNSFWIPCIPTSPDVVVTTYNFKEYDPRFGFKVNMTEIYNERLDDITCKFERGNSFEQRFIYINLDSNFDYEFEPNIIAPINEAIFTTENLMLTCTIVVNMQNFSVVWNTPNRNKSREIINNRFIPIHNGKILISTLTIQNTERKDEGFYKCFVEKEKSFSVYIKIRPIFDDKPIIDAPAISLGDTLIMHCKILIDHNIQFNLHWNHFIRKDSRKMITNIQYIPHIKKTLGISTLIIKNVTLQDQQNYSCSAFDYKNNSNSISTQIIVQDPFKPIIYDSNMNNTKFNLKIGDPFTLSCFAKGLPKPTLQWWKNKILIKENDPHLKISENKNKLLVDHAKLNDNGIYACSAMNILGSDFIFTNIDIQTMKEPRIVIYILIVIIIIILMMIFTLLFSMKLQKMKKFRKKIEMLQYQQIENMNTDEIITVQADLLKYDKKWELPRNKIKLRERLGTGNFGIVMKADLISKTRKTVAVKMIKHCFDYMQVELFFSELKIMTYVGKHVNVINLIGACSENILNGELLIVVDYCIFGNLRNYLLKNRNNFIDLFNKKDTLINDTPVYVNIVDSTVTNISRVYYNVNPPPNYVNINDSTENQITTKDLIFWSFQIAQGMEFLASKKIMHGDLAARNILLSENNITKICDFGLSKNLHRSKNYKNKKHIPLPIKWMAIESIRDGIFSTQSDIWSFGIIVWELFSLASTPYFDLSVDSEFYKKLNDGYRMERPQYASKEIYQIMLDCWHEKPSCRPSFTKLVKVFEDLIDENTLKFYTELIEYFKNINEEI